ncbi:MAG: hypothetical protein ACRC0X_09500 [Brevinema sp.]
MLTPNNKEKLDRLEIILETSLRNEIDTAVIVHTSLERAKDLWHQLDETDKKYIFTTLKEIVREEEIVAKLLLGNCDKLLKSINYTQKLTEFMG